MKKSIRIISVILAASLTTGLLTGCGPAKKVSKMNADPAAAERIKKLNTTGDFPIVKEPINLKFMVATSATQDNYAGTLVWTEYEKMTNVHIDWETVPSNSIAERRNLVLSSGQNLPDAFYRCNFGSKDVTKYAGEGLFLGLNDLIDNYMPNFKKLMSSMDSLKRSMPDSNGEIYSLPSLTDCPETELSPKLFLNKPFMDRVGITKLPTTLDELYATCK
ncbi:MAG: extracellular solute-binding protein, partial [Bacteroidota bacterium]|nr:extracellular solute-binding protein [Bacteroidota bacterium]